MGALVLKKSGQKSPVAGWVRSFLPLRWTTLLETTLFFRLHKTFLSLMPVCKEEASRGARAIMFTGEIGSRSLGIVGTRPPRTCWRVGTGATMRPEIWGARKALVVAVIGCVSMIPAAGQEKAQTTARTVAAKKWAGRD
jgi:hypothetical protein